LKLSGHNFKFWQCWFTVCSSSPRDSVLSDRDPWVFCNTLSVEATRHMCLGCQNGDSDDLCTSWKSLVLVKYSRTDHVPTNGIHRRNQAHFLICLPPVVHRTSL
jgi:hypothetical protein